MIDVYNTLLNLAHERLDELASAEDLRPMSMPERGEIVEAMSRIMQDRFTVPNPVADPVLRRCLLRILEVNRLVLGDALAPRALEVSVVAKGSMAVADADDLIVPSGIVSWPLTLSGEMQCPECRFGSLCYLIGREGGAFVECSTVDCLYWDARR